jgi:hypothetical protein
MGVYIYVVIVVSLLVLPSLVFVLVNRERGVPGRRPRGTAPRAGAVPGVTLPPDARPPLSVFFEGVELEPERDYDLRGQQILLHTALQPYTPSVWREFITTAAGVGFYGRGAQLDVQYATAAGGRHSRMLPVVPLHDVTTAGAAGDGGR